MAGDIAGRGVDSDSRAFGFGETVAELLPRGHAIHAYSSAADERVVRVLEGRQYADEAPLLGFGVDGQAERALGRALLTYAMRERDGLTYISATHYTESDHAQIPSDGHRSQFDSIVWNGHVSLYQEGDLVIASSSFGGGHGMAPLEVTADDALAAITILVDTYQYVNQDTGERMRRLPVISLE
jgi:hypothetical protein